MEQMAKKRVPVTDEEKQKSYYKYFEQAGRNRNVTYQLINGMQEIKLQGCEQRKR